MIGTLTASVADLCERAAGYLPGPGSEQAAALRRRLDEPLGLAVAGRVKAGKSTLVNALAGRRVAPTAETECTRVVTRFRYAPDERYEVVPRSGPAQAHRLPAGGLPEAFPLPPSEIARVDVWLSSEPLRTCTIIDTPGLSSTNEDISARASELLGTAVTTSPTPGTGLDADSRHAVSAAEAVLFVLNQGVHEDERAVLAAFRALSGDTGTSPVNAMAVLTKADLLAGQRGEADPWQNARDVAATCAQNLREAVATVVPVAGLLAETVRAGRVGEAEAAALRRLAALGSARLRLLLLSADRFVSGDAPVDTDMRHRLVDRLGMYGIRKALAATGDGVTSSAALLDDLALASGFDALAEGVDAVFRRRADAIKASAALCSLRAVAYSTGIARPDAEWLQDELELLRLDPHMHALEELDAASAVLTGRVRLPGDLAAEVARFGAGSGPADKLDRRDVPRAELASVALAGARRWRGIANGMPPSEARVASIMHRAHHLLWEQLATSAGNGS